MKNKLSPLLILIVFLLLGMVFGNMHRLAPISGLTNWFTSQDLSDQSPEDIDYQGGSIFKNFLNLLSAQTPLNSNAASAGGGRVNNEQLLARAINGEARGEPYQGQVAVGAVILNRIRDSRFPHTIPGVIYQPGAFTAVADGQINVPLGSNSSVIKASRDALNGWDPSSGCVYYWNPATATSKWIWSRKIVKKIGKHYFGK